MVSQNYIKKMHYYIWAIDFSTSGACAEGGGHFFAPENHQIKSTF